MIKQTFKNLTTLKVGGKIEYFKEVKNKEELIDAVKFAKDKKLDIFTIGGGSDILVGDKDFNGLVIKYTGNGIKLNGNKITAEAGLTWDKLVETAVNENLQGIECLSGIPGTVGASPIQNIGAYGQELKDTFLELTAFDIENEKFISFDKEKCKFGYRESFFKRKENFQKYIITDVTFKLNKSIKPSITYDSLKNYFTKNKIKNITLKSVRNAVLVTRAEKLEDPNEIPNAGSFFKNPILNEESYKRILKSYPDMPVYKNNDGMYKCSAGWFIEKTNWKGKSLGSVKVSDKHALILTNPNGVGNFHDIKNLADKITDDVYKKFNIKLEPEVQYINI